MGVRAPLQIRYMWLPVSSFGSPARQRLEIGILFEAGNLKCLLSKRKF